MPTPEHIAEAFRASVGDERFRKFLRILHTTALAKGRLLAWQDMLWSRFVQDCPEAPTTFSDIVGSLRICPVHLSRMTMETVPVEHGHWHFPDAVLRARDELFPFANYVEYAADFGDECTCVLTVCHECRAALDRWNVTHKYPFGVPSHRVGPSPWAGEYFVIDDVMETPAGLALVGRADDAGDPWPGIGETVEFHPPSGLTRTATVLGIDKGITRSCFSDGSAQRMILIAPDALPEPPARGTWVRAAVRKV